MAWSIQGQPLCSRGGQTKVHSRRLPRCTPFVASLLVAATAGCAVDDRTLLAANASGGTSSNSGAGSSGLGNGFAAAPAQIDLPVCSYSTSTKVEPGCETLVSNAGFSADTSGWAEEPLSITIGWDEGDATGSDSSGSIAVINSMHGRKDGIAASGGTQCLAAVPGKIYDMAADVLIPDGQGSGYVPDDKKMELGEAPYVGRAGLSILFWPNDECSNTEQSLLPSFQTDLVEDVDAWSRVEGAAQAPDGAASMSVRVLTVKPFQEYNFKALFDNVLLRER
jgi:hypothetical protein